MIQITGLKYAIAITLALLLTSFTVGAGASADSTPRLNQSHLNNGKPGTATPTSLRVVLWREPADIESRDLFYGPGGRAGAPDTSTPFTFVRHSKSGTQKKVIVEDNQGREWTVKFGREARPETTATRIFWAAGYHVDQNYFVPQARIIGKENIDARNVRFERRDDGYKEIGHWEWSKNPFLGTCELDGLKVLMALLKNWDFKTINNDIVYSKKKPGPNIYYISDLGATFGQTGTFINSVPLFSNWPVGISFTPQKVKANPQGFADERFIEEVRDGMVNFYARNDHVRSRFKGISVANARWMGNLLGRLSDKQLADAFCAGGFNQAETALYVSILRGRIRQLQLL